ncbi:DoxX family protein [Bradyrhizobium sp. Pear76]|uniref:DoxX family protein n=1 Tax=Bradyrhizobium oropedii TaxID=1571201 RepID=UPI001E2E6550|nr:DoxX family protein [Bradyrhizobium oropedii]MCC8964284.1 DoxX family protein [Bradyrhizobium oropedii]
MNSILLLIGRILMSVLFLISGIKKFGMAAQMAGMVAQIGLPAPLLMVYLMGACELVAVAALIIGFQTRIVGILLAVWCVATGFVVHAGDPVQLMKNIGLAGGFLILAATTPGTIAYYGNWPERRTGAVPQA